MDFLQQLSLGTILADGAMLPDHQTTGSSHTEIPSYAAARADLHPALDPATAPNDGAGVSEARYPKQQVNGQNGKQRFEFDRGHEMRPI